MEASNGNVHRPVGGLVVIGMGLGATAVLTSSPRAGASADAPIWKQIATTGPAARFGAGMAYDPATGQLVLFGAEHTLWNGTS